jgi:hypothetical protein
MELLVLLILMFAMLTSENIFCTSHKYLELAYFPDVARVFIYPNLIVICVPSLADNFYSHWRYITHTSADLHTVTSSH